MMATAESSTICLTVDVEWACPEVLADLCRLLDERGVRATFFCTHAGIDVGRHERGLPPNFRPDGDCLKALAARHGGTLPTDLRTIYGHVVAWFKAFAPEACGVRAHSLYYDSQLLRFYREHGIRYESTYQLPLAGGLRPFWKEYGIVEMPIYFNDYFDIKTAATGFDLASLRLDRPGLKVLNFHPNIVYLNADTEAFYLDSKAVYGDADRLLARRRHGPGIRELFLRLLDHIAGQRLATATLAEVDAAWRQAEPCPWGERPLLDTP